MAGFIKNNPVWFMASVEAVVAAVLNLLLAFAVQVTAVQTAAINGVVLVVVALVLGLWAQTPIQRMLDEARAAGYTKGLTAKHD
jgi:hypothetical protein